MASELQYVCSERAVQVLAVRTAPVLDVRTIAKSSSPGFLSAELLQQYACVTDAVPVYKKNAGLARNVVSVLTIDILSTSDGAYIPG